MLRRTMKVDGVKTLMMILNGILIIFDLIWVVTMGIIWKRKPTHDTQIWDSFSGLHSLIIALSIINIVLRAVSIVTLFLTSSK